MPNSKTTREGPTLPPMSALRPCPLSGALTTAHASMFRLTIAMTLALCQPLAAAPDAFPNAAPTTPKPQPPTSAPPSSQPFPSVPAKTTGTPALAPARPAPSAESRTTPQPQPRPQATPSAQSPPPKPAEQASEETWVSLVVNRPSGGPISNRLSNFSANMVSEIRLRIAKKQLDTPEPILASRPVSQLSSVTAPFACISLDLSDLQSLPSNQKALMEGYLRRGGFLWVVAHAPSPDYDFSKDINGELFTEEILKRVLPESLITSENVKPIGFPQVIPPSVIDPTLSTELTSLISQRLRTMDILSLAGRPAAVVSLTFPTQEIKDIYEHNRPPTLPNTQRQPSNPNAKRPIHQNQNKGFSINHLAVNLYANILLH